MIATFFDEALETKENLLNTIKETLSKATKKPEVSQKII